MNKQRINELGSDIRTLHNEIAELTNIGAVDNAANLEPAFNEKLLALINIAPVSYTHLTLPTNREV